MSKWILAAPGTQKQSNKSESNKNPRNRFLAQKESVVQVDRWQSDLLWNFNDNCPQKTERCVLPILEHSMKVLEAENKTSCLLTQDLFLSVSLATVQLNRSFTCWSPWQCSTPLFSCITHTVLERVQGCLQSTLLSSLRLPSALRNILVFYPDNWSDCIL